MDVVEAERDGGWPGWARAMPASWLVTRVGTGRRSGSGRRCAGRRFPTRGCGTPGRAQSPSRAPVAHATTTSVGRPSSGSAHRRRDANSLRGPSQTEPSRSSFTSAGLAFRPLIPLVHRRDGRLRVAVYRHDAARQCRCVAPLGRPHAGDDAQVGAGRPGPCWLGGHPSDSAAVSGNLKAVSIRRFLQFEPNRRYRISRTPDVVARGRCRRCHGHDA